MARTGRVTLLDPYSSPYDFYSGHPAGANFLLCDGSARRFTNLTSLATMHALGTRDGGRTWHTELRSPRLAFVAFNRSRLADVPSSR